MNITVLPAECISLAISFTSPRDACTSSLVSSVFRAASDSDIAWEKFLPHDYKQIISKSLSSSSLLNSMSKKDLYSFLCNHYIIIGNGNMSFALEKQSGKKCYMIGARGLSVAWGDTPNYWQWITHLPHSRFSEVAKLKLLWLLDIKGCIETEILSPETTYAAYLVYQLSESKWGFERKPIVMRINYNQGLVVAVHTVILDPPEGLPPRARERGDGWLEIEMGEFFNHGTKATLECSVREISNSKSGLILEGIELRPKDIEHTE